MRELLEQLPIDRVLLVIFVAGQLWERVRAGESSRRSQGERIGKLEDRVAALEASRGRA